MKIGPFVFKTRKELKAEITKKNLQYFELSLSLESLVERYRNEFIKKYPPKIGCRFITSFPGNIYTVAIMPEMPVWKSENGEVATMAVIHQEDVHMKRYCFADSPSFHLGYCVKSKEWIIGVHDGGEE